MYLETQLSRPQERRLAFAADEAAASSKLKGQLHRSGSVSGLC